MVRQFETAADRGHYDTRPLCPGLLQQQSGEYPAVRGVEMAHGLVQQDEIERLAQTAHERDALLLPEREFPGRGVPFGGDPDRLQQAFDLPGRLERGQFGRSWPCPRCRGRGSRPRSVPRTAAGPERAGSATFAARRPTGPRRRCGNLRRRRGCGPHNRSATRTGNCTARICRFPKRLRPDNTPPCGTSRHAPTRPTPGLPDRQRTHRAPPAVKLSSP